MTIKQTSSLCNLAEALSKAQSEFTVVPKLHSAKIPTKSGGEYSYRYADLADTVEAARPILAQNGLAVSHFPDFEDGYDILSTRLLHTSGEWLEASMRLFLSAENPQAHGSAITYAKRYAFSSIIGLVADEDDDGGAATHHGGSNAPRASVSRPTSTQTLTDAQAAALVKIHVARNLDIEKGVMARWGKTLDQLMKSDASRWLDELNGKVGAPEPGIDGGNPF